MWHVGAVVFMLSPLERRRLCAWVWVLICDMNR